MTELNRELFTPVLAWLDAGGRGLNMAYFQSEDEEDFEGHPCGTVMCIAGALTEFNNIETPGPLTLGRSIGMTTTQVCGLFFAQSEPGTYMGSAVEHICSFNEITPAMAAKAIRSMLETGKVQWS